MPDTWITRADLESKFGKDEVARVADVDSDAVNRAIMSVEGRVRSRLLTRYQPGELPASEEAPEALKRVVVGLAWYELHQVYKIVDAAVVLVRADADSELDDLVRGHGSLELAGEPAVDSTRPAILTSPSRPDRLTLENLE